MEKNLEIKIVALAIGIMISLGLGLTKAIPTKIHALCFRDEASRQWVSVAKMDRGLLRYEKIDKNGVRIVVDSFGGRVK